MGISSFRFSNSTIAQRIYLSVGIIIAGYCLSMLFVITEGLLMNSKLTTGCDGSFSCFPAGSDCR